MFLEALDNNEVMIMTNEWTGKSSGEEHWSTPLCTLPVPGQEQVIVMHGFAIGNVKHEKRKNKIEVP